MSIIEISHVTKEYRLGQLHGARETFRNIAARLTGRPVPARNPFKALDDVDFKVEQGEVLGIIGHNGAGKSTLLKILSGISRPTTGTVRVRGRVAPLIEVGAGLVPDMTGRENIFLNATILGMKRREIQRKFDDIVAFAELEQFIDTPVKKYSSGMQVRLGFSIATSVDADILIVDEVLAVGDLAFQRKCFDRMEALIENEGRTVLLVSHNIRQVARICTRAVLLSNGRVTADGDPIQTTNLFYEQSDHKIQQESIATHPGSAGKSMSSGEIELTGIRVLGLNGQPTRDVPYLSGVTVAMRFLVRRRLAKPVFGLGLHTTDFFYISTNHHHQDRSPPFLDPGIHEVRCVIHRLPFLPGNYSLRVGVSVGEKRHTVFYVENAYPLKITSGHLDRSDPDVSEGIVAMDTTWHLPQQRSDETECAIPERRAAG